MRLFKRGARFVLTSAPIARYLLAPRDRTAVLMLHRFAHPDLGVKGHDPAELRAMLAALRRLRRPLVGVDRLVDAVRGGPPMPAGTVVFTVDEGYRDFAEVGAPVFAAFDCPVAVFLVSGFLDRQLWCWWDRVEYAFSRTSRNGLVLEPCGRRFTWNGERERDAAIGSCVEALKRLPDAERLAQLEEVARRLDVEVPPLPPDSWSAMTWDDARRLARRGVSFGPQTVTHPILSRATDAKAEREIVDSWTRVRGEIPDASPAFCYPNGTLDSFGEREASIVERAGLALAVAATEGYVTTERLRQPGVRGRYALPRFSYDADPYRNRATALGLVRESQDCRGHFARADPA